jgi:hypothetical protein
MSLRTFTYVTFTLAALILAGELLHYLDGNLLVVTLVQAIATSALIFVLPFMFLFVTKEDGFVEQIWSIRRLVFSGLSWLFYVLCILASATILRGGWKVVCSENFGSGSFVGMLAVVSFVFFISSAQETGQGSRKQLELFFTMKVMLVLIATMLAVLAEMSLYNRGNKRLAAIEGCISAALFTIVLFNTHGLGGRLMHNTPSRSRSNSAASHNSTSSSDRSMSPQMTPDSSPLRRGSHRTDAETDSDASPERILAPLDGDDISDDGLDEEDGRTAKWSFWQPFVGGVKFVLLQILSWFFFGFSIVFGFLFILSTFTIGFEIFVGVMALAGMCCIISEILMIISIHVYEKQPTVLQPTPSALKDEAAEDSTRPSFSTPWASTPWRLVVRDLHALVVTVCVVNMQFLPFLGIFPVFAILRMDTLSATLVHWFSACVTIGVYTLAHSYFKARQFNMRRPWVEVGDQSAKKTGRQRGASTSKAAARTSNRNSDKGSSSNSKGSSSSSSSSKDGGGSAEGKKAGSTADHCKIGDDFHYTHNAVLLVVTCVPLFVTCHLASVGSRALAGWIVVTVSHFLYVGLTYKGAPEITGCREIERIKRDGPFIHYMGETVRRYFGGSVIKEGELDPAKVYVMGFHPHGILPITVFWLRCCDDKWKVLFPGVTFSMLTASVMHFVPIMRDIMQWMGGREVSRESFRHALRAGRSCLVVPGGQAEMLHSVSDSSEVCVVTKHRGFVRMALAEGADLVPILSIGESDLLDNVRMPTVQQWFLKRTGIAAPHFPYGCFYLPIPRPRKVTVIVGRPIPVLRVSDPSDAVVKATLDTYLRALLEMYDRHRVAAGEPPGRKLIFIEDPHSGKHHKFGSISSIKVGGVQ